MGWLYRILEQKMSYIMQQLHTLWQEAEKNIVLILDVKTTFSQIKQKKTSYHYEEKIT